MNKEEFLNNLKYELKGIKEGTRKDVLEDYEEHFEEAGRRGESEEDVCKELGNPKDIAKELRAYAVVEQAENNFSFENIFKVAATFLSLGIFNLIFIFPYFFSVMAILGMAFVSIALVAGGIGGFAVTTIGMILNISSITLHAAPSILYSLLAMGGGAFLGILSYFSVRSFYKFTIKYIKMNINLVKDKE